jgi:hypothetical protein
MMICSYDRKGDFMDSPLFPKTGKQKIPENIITKILKLVKTPLNFCVLVVLIIDSTLGGFAAKTSGQNQLFALGGFILVTLVLIIVVSYFAYTRNSVFFSGANNNAVQPTKELQDFLDKVSGHWFQFITPDEPSAISVIEITPHLSTCSVKMKGNAYSKVGNNAAIWESVASCIDPDEYIVFYSWKGWHPFHPNEPFEGFGKISFHKSKNELISGDGIFSDINLIDTKSMQWKSVKMKRCTDKDVKALNSGDTYLLSKLIMAKLEE